MHRWLLPLLACPACRTRGLIEIDGLAPTDSRDPVDEGRLKCAGCAATYPVRRGILRFLATDARQCRNFGFRWQRWRTNQIDRLAGHDLSARRFLADSRWEREWPRGRLVLDAGCGAGGFADLAALAGARAVACDISAARSRAEKHRRPRRRDPGRAGFDLRASVLRRPTGAGVGAPARRAGIMIGLIARRCAS